MNKLLLHPRTSHQLDAFLAKPSHAVLISGPTGSGKATVARAMAEAALELAENAFSTHAYTMQLGPIDGKAIGIEQVRSLDHFLSLKVPATKTLNRAVIVEDAHKMTLEAQNALLKTLEEPPADTLIILTATYPETLLPTIRSRAQTITIKQPAEQATITYLVDQGYGQKQVEQAFRMSGGLPGLMHAILEDEEHPLLLATEQARQLLKKTVYERILMVDQLAKQKELALDTLFILGQMAHLSLQNAQGSASKRWQKILQASYTAREALLQSGQPKLVLSKLMLEL